MPIDFSILERAPTIAQGFMAGQQAAQQQAEQNRLRDMQMLQMEAQRENILAQRSQREQALRERQAAERIRNALAVAGNDPEKLIQLGPEGVKLATEITALNKARGEVFTQRMTAARQFLDTLDPNDPTAPQRYLQWHEANHRDPIIGPMLAARGITADQARARIDQAVQQGPQALANLIAQSKLGTEKFMEQNKPFAVGGSLYDPVTRTFTQPPVKPTPGETEELVTRLQDPSLTPQARSALEARLRILTTREPREPKEPALRTTKVELADGTIGVMNLDTGEVTPAKVGSQVAKGKPSAFAEKTAAQRKQLAVDLERAIIELKDASKEGGLIDQSTGSGAGRLVDVGAGFFGKATPGAIAIGKLAPIADLVLKMVPRFEGPQSDKDTKSYKEAAGQLSDATLPTKIRKNAAKEIVRLMESRKGQFATQDMAIEGAGAAPATTRSGSTVSNW